MLGGGDGCPGRQWPHDHQLHRALAVVVALAVQWSPPLASVVTTTGRLLMVVSVIATTGCLPLIASAGPVAGQLPEATNRPGGMPPRAPLRKRDVRAVRLDPRRMLGILHVPALPVLDRLLNHTVPHTTTLDGGRPLAQPPRPFRPQQLDRAGVGALAPGLHPQQLAVMLAHLEVGLLVGLVVLLLVARIPFAVGGTVGLLLGDLVGGLGLLGLLTGLGEVTSAQPPRRTMLQEGDQVAGLLAATGRLGKPLVALFAPAGRMREQAGPVAWRLVL